MSAPPQGPAPRHWRAFRGVTAPATDADDVLRARLLAALTVLDAGTLTEVADGCGVTTRTIFRALAWLRTHRPELIAHLRERTTSPRGHDTQSG